VSTLALRLAGPLQSWGARARFQARRTEHQPTKSGIVGLLAAALGRARVEPIEDLMELLFGVRIDQPGEVVRDFHTVSSLFDEKGRYNPSGGRLPVARGGYRKTETSTQTTERYYLADAVFVAAVEGEVGLLAELDQALSSPVFPPFLGRRSCPPAGPVNLGISPGSLLEVLGSVEWQASPRRRRSSGSSVTLEVIVDDATGDREAYDVARSFDPIWRTYSSRRTRYHFVELPNPDAAVVRVGPEHDPLGLLEG
jgi:CRISPR system Cascade subunit CasD